MADFTKDFEVGDHVKVVYGKYLGKMGVITDRSVANGENRKMFRIGDLWYPLRNLELITDADIQAAHDADMEAQKAMFAGNLETKIATLEYDLKLAYEKYAELQVDSEERINRIIFHLNYINEVLDGVGISRKNDQGAEMSAGSRVDVAANEIAALKRERDDLLAQREGGFAEYMNVLNQLQAVTKERDALRAFYDMAHNMDLDSDMWELSSATGGDTWVEVVTIAHNLNEVGIETNDPIGASAMLKAEHELWETPDTVGISDVLQSRAPQAFAVGDLVQINPNVDTSQCDGIFQQAQRDRYLMEVDNIEDDQDPLIVVIVRYGNKTERFLAHELLPDTRKEDAQAGVDPLTEGQ